jgi:hypothetical protein
LFYRVNRTSGVALKTPQKPPKTPPAGVTDARSSQPFKLLSAATIDELIQQSVEHESAPDNAGAIIMRYDLGEFEVLQRGSRKVPMRPPIRTTYHPFGHWTYHAL